MGPSFLEGGHIMCWSCPSVCLSVRLCVPCLHLEGKRKDLRIPNLAGRVSGTPAPRGPILRSRGQRSRSRRLIALLAKNSHNFAACCPINLIFGRWRKDPLPPCTGWPRCHGNGRSVRLSVRLSVVCLHLERKRNGLGRPNLVGRIPGTRAPRGPWLNWTWLNGRTLLFHVHWFHSSCHSLTHNWLTQVNKSVTGNLMLVMATSSPALAAMSASSFFLITIAAENRKQRWTSWGEACRRGVVPEANCFGAWKLLKMHTLSINFISFIAEMHCIC